MAFAESAIAFAKGDIENPIQTLLDSPVAPGGVGKNFGVGGSFRADLERLLGRDRCH
jgi:hypothetical protein